MDVRKLKKINLKYWFILPLLVIVIFACMNVVKITAIKADESDTSKQNQPSKSSLFAAGTYAGAESLLDLTDFVETPAGDKTAVLENPINHSKLGFVQVAFPEEYVPWTGKALDNISWLVKDPDGVTMTDIKKVPIDIPYIGGKRLYSSKVPSTLIQWNSLNKQDSVPLDVKFYKHKNKNILKAIVKDTQNKLTYVYVLRLELNLNFSINLYMINDDTVSKKASLLHYVDAGYYTHGLGEYNFGNSTTNQVFYLSPYDDDKKITLRMRNTKNQWLSDVARFNLIDFDEKGNENLFGDNFLTKGIEDAQFPPGMVQIMYNPIYQLGVPPKTLKYHEALKSGFEIFVGNEIDYLDLDVNPKKLQVYDSFKEASINYKVDKFTASSKSGKLYLLDHEENEHLVDEYIVNDMKPVSGNFVLSREMLPEKLQAGAYNIGVVTHDNNYLSSQEEIIEVNVHQLKVSPQLKALEQNKPFNLSASDLVKITGLMPGHKATIEYIGNSTIDTGVEGLHYLEVRVADKQVSPVEEKTVRVPILVYKELPPLINGNYLYVKNIEAKESELKTETNDINNWLLEKSSALGWYSTATEDFLIDGVELSVSKTNLTSTSKAGNYTATINANFPNGEHIAKDIVITLLPDKIAYPQPILEGIEDKTDGKIKAVIKQALPKQPTAEAYEALALSVNLGAYSETNYTTKVMIGAVDWTDKVTITKGSTPAPENAFTVKHSISAAMLKEMSESQPNDVTLTIMIEAPMKKTDASIINTFNSNTGNFELPIRVRASNQESPVHDIAKVNMQLPSADPVTGKKVLVGTSTKELKASDYISNLASMLSFDTVEIVRFEEKTFNTVGPDTLSVVIRSKETDVTNTINVSIQVIAAKIPYKPPVLTPKKQEDYKKFDLIGDAVIDLPKQAEDSYYQALDIKLNLGKYAEVKCDAVIKVGENIWPDQITPKLQRNAKGEVLATFQFTKELVKKMSESQTDETMLKVEFSAPLVRDNEEIMEYFIANDDTEIEELESYFEFPISVKESISNLIGNSAIVTVYPPLPEVTNKAMQEILQGTVTSNLNIEGAERFVNIKPFFTFDTISSFIEPTPPVLNELGDQVIRIAIWSDMTLIGNVYQVPIKVIPKKIDYPKPVVEGGTDKKDGQIKASVKQSLPKQLLDRYYEDFEITVNLGKYAENIFKTKLMIGTTDWTNEVPTKAEMTIEGYQITYSMDAELLRKMSDSQNQAVLSIDVMSPMKKNTKTVITEHFNKETGNFDIPVLVKTTSQLKDINATAHVSMMIDAKPIDGKTLEVGTDTSTLKATDYVNELTSLLDFDQVRIIGIEKKIFEVAGEDTLDVKIQSSETGVTKLISVPVTIVASPLGYITLSEKIDLKNVEDSVVGTGKVSYTGSNKNAVIYVKTAPTFKLENKSQTDKVDVPLYKENGDPIGTNKLLTVLNHTTPSSKFFARTLQKKFNAVDIYNGTFLVDFEVIGQ